MNFDTAIAADIIAAADFLKSGEIVAIPTETVYGLAGNGLDKNVVLKIFNAKNRPHFDPLILHINSIDALNLYTKHIPEIAVKLAQKFWPGPLTLLLPKKDIVPDLVTSGLDTVAVRVPNHPLALQLLALLDFPLAAPSANPFGYISPTTAQHVYAQLQGKIPYILDGGPCGVGVESTIVGFENDKVIVYRLGGISIEDIEAVTGPVQARISSSNPTAPGMLKSHYAPKKPLITGNVNALLNMFSDRKTGVITFCKPATGATEQIQLSPTADLNEAAKNLFAAMRYLDNSNVDIILADIFPETGLGRAINDRLKRAAAEE